MTNEKHKDASDSPAELKRWVGAWSRAEKELALLKTREAADGDLARQIMSLEDAFQAAFSMHHPRSTSGLVEQQALFARVGH